VLRWGVGRFLGWMVWLLEVCFTGLLDYWVDNYKAGLLYRSGIVREQRWCQGWCSKTKGWFRAGGEDGELTSEGVAVAAWYCGSQ
jgi:hypothetical protein